MSKLFKITVKENRQIAENHFILTSHPLKKIAKPKPGQFFMLSVGSGINPLLKRPFSLYRWLEGDFQILYRVVGKTTSILKKRKPGDILEIIGPLGRGFPVIKKTRKKKIILVAGGIGIAPIFALAETIKKRSSILFYGAKTKNEVLCIEELKSIGIDPIVSTDDGSMGEKATVIDMLEEYFTRYASRRRSLWDITHHCLYACGPKPMLRSLSFLVKKYKIEGYIALEENMACGFGACLGCIVKTGEGNKRVCKEGPVFSTEEIVW